MRCLGLVPSCFASENRASDEEMIEFFKDDLMFPSVARAELELWRSHFDGKDLPETPQAAFQQANPVKKESMERQPEKVEEELELWHSQNCRRSRAGNYGTVRRHR